MRRSSFIQLTLLPMLASARLIHADPDPTPTGAPGYGPPGDTTGQVNAQSGAPPGEAAPAPTYIAPDGTVVLMPPGLVQPVVVEVPCDQDPDQERCHQGVSRSEVYWRSSFRGGFGGYFGGHGGYGGHGGGWGG
jgi:hypothetical protein